MIHTIIKKSTCKDCEKCSDNIIDKIKEEYSNFNPFGTNQNCYVHIIHEKNNHKINVSILDNYIGTKPSLKKLENILRD